MTITFDSATCRWFLGRGKRQFGIWRSIDSGLVHCRCGRSTCVIRIHASVLAKRAASRRIHERLSSCVRRAHGRMSFAQDFAGLEL